MINLKMYKRNLIKNISQKIANIILDSMKVKNCSDQKFTILYNFGLMLDSWCASKNIYLK